MSELLLFPDPQYVNDLWDTFEKDTAAETDWKLLPPRASGGKQIVANLEEVTSSIDYIIVVDVYMQEWLDPTAFAQVRHMYLHQSLCTGGERCTVPSGAPSVVLNVVPSVVPSDMLSGAPSDIVGW